MANKSIKDFPESTSPSGEWFVLVDDGTGCYYKVKLKNLPGGGGLTTTTTTLAPTTTSSTTTAPVTTSTTTTASGGTTTSTSSSTTSSTTTIAYDPDALAFFAAAGITDVNQKGAVNTMVLSLKSGGLWTKLKAVYPFVGGTASSHKYNLKNPADTDGAFRIVFNGGVTHNANGVTFNGSTGYGDTKFTMANFNSTTDLSIGVYNRSTFINSYAFGIADMGIYGSPAQFGLFAFIRRFYPNGFGDQWTPAWVNGDYFGFISSIVRGAADSETYRNGVSLITQTTNINSNSPSAGQSIYIGAANNNSGTSVDNNAFNYAFAYLGDALSDAEALSFYNIVQAYQTALGRQVV